MMKTRSSLSNQTTTTTTTKTPQTTNKKSTKTNSTFIWNNLDNANFTIMRPNTLNVNRENNFLESQKLLRDALNAWCERATHNHVPADKLQELFQELQCYLNEEQVFDMLQQVKKYVRRKNNVECGVRHLHGLTFGEFCVLLADLKKYGTFSNMKHDNYDISNLNNNNNIHSSSIKNYRSSLTGLPQKGLKRNVSSKERKVSDKIPTLRKSASGTFPSTQTDGAAEVFLGGSCNPTTWRADNAIPALENVGISFYNPQVSNWTPDLIELEHRAKEKARVLFFVMDSETRASAGAIEAAHIAGQNSKALVLVLHPYRPDQKILNEPVSSQEFIDLSRNQQLLRELASRSGVRVFFSIESGLERTISILRKGECARDAPHMISKELISVSNAFHFQRVVEETKDTINLIQCQNALSGLGYPKHFLTLDFLTKVIETYNETQQLLLSSCKSPATSRTLATKSNLIKKNALNDDVNINFDSFCVIAAYLSVLHHKNNSSDCVSPIKGFDLAPPPIYFNRLECFHSPASPRCENLGVKILNDDRHSNLNQTNIFDYKLNRDSGTSSPQLHIETRINSYLGDDANQQLQQQQQHPNQLNGVTLLSTSISPNATTTKISVNVQIISSGDDSDSRDSVLSCCSSADEPNDCMTKRRDIYLGGSCMLRTRWRQDFAIPYLKKKGITYHIPKLHESIHPDSFTTSVSVATEPTSSSSSSSSDNNLPHSEKRLKSSINLSNDKNNSHDTIIITSQNTIPTTIITNTTTDSNTSSSNNLNLIASNNLRKKSLNLIEKDFYDFPIFGNTALYNPEILTNSRVLFFLITNETRSLAPMTLAAHYIGLNYNVVLCVEMLPENCQIGSDILTPSAIKDYNRGRAYLIDLAKKKGIPVFNDRQNALDCAISLVEKIYKLRETI